MEKLLATREHVQAAIKALAASEDNSPEMFLLGVLKRAEKNITDRINSLKGAATLTDKPAPAAQPPKVRDEIAKLTKAEMALWIGEWNKEHPTKAISLDILNENKAAIVDAIALAAGYPPQK